MEDELWMRKIKERLDDYSEPLPVSGWERLEKDLSVSKPPVAGKRRIIPFRRWAVAAAAALLVAVSSVSVWLLQSPVGEEMRNMTAPALGCRAGQVAGATDAFSTDRDNRTRLSRTETGISGGYEPAFLAGTTTEYRR